jgi:hypothetical protein
MPSRARRFRSSFTAAIASAVCAADADKTWPERTVRIMTVSAGSLPTRWREPRPTLLPGAGSSRSSLRTVLALTCHAAALPGGARRAHAPVPPHSALTVNPLLHGTLPYDPERDFAPISLAVDDFLCVAARLAWRRTTPPSRERMPQPRPGHLTWHGLPSRRAGISTTFVPYKVGTER